MNAVGYSITFFVSWWLFLFMVLPIGVITHSETDEEIKDGIEVGSPVHANIKKKMLITTGITIIFMIIVAIVDYLDLVSIK
ncbi:MAG: DUF1467 family protein [Kordiimonadaceae bacterium]|jgi:predicted secreted protein|nr:DUF1467 family protein [Kordiimonadaceae bacterium]MBT6031498.1 DUF1467 family protein [Kordiimonadaceae bacterium]